MKDSKGNILKWYGTTTDFQEHKELEEVLEKRISERTADLERQKIFINSILDASLNSIVALDAIRDDSGKVSDFRFVKINKVFTDFFNLDESVLGKSYLSYFPRSTEIGVFDLYRQVLITGEPVRKEFYSTSREPYAWLELSVVKRDENGIVVSFANISPQREAAIRIEEQKNLLDSILTYAPGGILVFTAIRDQKKKVVDFKCIVANEAAEKFTGISMAESQSKTVFQIRPVFKDSPFFQMSIAALDEGKPFRVEYYNGRLHKWLELLMVKMNDENLISVIWDISPVKDAQLQLEKTVEDLKYSNANLQDFAFAASHDMKEPVRKILTFADLLKSSLATQMNEAQTHYFDRMQVAATRMKSLMEGLLYYTEVSRDLPAPEEVDMNSIIGQVLRDLQPEIKEKGARISADELFVIKGNQGQLQQVFQNLVRNALNYSKPGVEPEISISCKRIPGKHTGLRLSLQDLQKEFYMIEVSDNGIGFDQQDAERIFNVFQHLSHNENRGSGLGLAIVKKVVENHNGHVAAEGEPGAGATFKVLLPVH